MQEPEYSGSLLDDEAPRNKGGRPRKATSEKLVTCSIKLYPDEMRQFIEFSSNFATRREAFLYCLLGGIQRLTEEVDDKAHNVALADGELPVILSSESNRLSCGSFFVSDK